MSLQTVVDADRRRLRGSVFTRQGDDARGRHTGNRRGAGGCPFLYARRQLLEAERVARHVIRIVATFADDHVHHRQRQRAVRAGADGDPFVAGLCGACVGRVDDDHAGALFACLLHEGPEMQVASQRIAAPNQDQAGVGEIFGQHPFGGADGVEVAFEAGFGADCAGKLAGAHAVEEARRHAFALQEAERAAVGVRQHRLGAMGGDDARSRAAMSAMASSHVTGAKWPLPFGPTRRSGVVSRPA
jgi:hypothetical protein